MLDNACVDGRRASEQAVRAALGFLAVTAERPPAHLNAEDRQLRRSLRAKSRQLGDQGEEPNLLIAECAYEQWHRLLFARFLAENNLLIHPEYGAPVTLEDCDELAGPLKEPDGWAVAARFAAEILPGIFRLDDPCVQLRLAPEGRLALEEIVAGLSAAIFLGDDALGWAYQYWQKEQKDEVNDSGRKVSGVDLGPVTQLFTENYMVRFLLENSLGAWWATRHPQSSLIKEWEYLRVEEDGHAAAGSFDGWPDCVADITVMDPCCGSGHFLIEAFEMLWRMRAEEEALDAQQAQAAVLRDNLFGLELDGRCVQIAAFAVALAAWKAGGYRELPRPAVACAGIPIRGQLSQWKDLAAGEPAVEEVLVALHAQFSEAPQLGSLIDPQQATPDGSLFSVDYAAVGPVLERLLAREVDPQATVAGLAAAGIAQAAELLSRHYTLVVTNVPYLGIQRMPERMAGFLERRYPLSSNDLATVFIERCHALAPQGTAALVTPLNWLFLKSFGKLRKSLLRRHAWNFLCPLGKGAFDAISGHVVQAALVIQSSGGTAGSPVALLDVTDQKTISAKRRAVRESPVGHVDQDLLIERPDTLLSIDPAGGALLSTFASSWEGLTTSDVARYIVKFWELPEVSSEWELLLTAPTVSAEYTGRESLVRWESGEGSLVRDGKAHNFNPPAVRERRGVLIGQGTLSATLYRGEMFNATSAPVVVEDESDVPALWCFLRSEDYRAAVRKVNSKIVVGAGYLVKVPYDVEHWRAIARAEYLDGLPDPTSHDPTQWPFEGHPAGSSEPLHVGTARLLGYRWPMQSDADDLGPLADRDGIVCLPSVRGERTAADRLQEVLARAYGVTWSATRTQELLVESGSSKKDLNAWLRDDFFKAHCQVFKNRPFIWHVWDGRRDGFSALVNYHKLLRSTLEKLTYSYLGDWIERQTAGVREDVAGAEERLAAARTLQQKLELILGGDPPYDIYVRWKSLAEQPVGWEPDLNDGVRLNVRPFVEARVLRAKFNVKWDKDRGTNHDGSDRLNNLHYTNAQKQAARGATA